MDLALAARAPEIVVADRVDQSLFAAISRPLADFNAHFAGPVEFRPLLLALTDGLSGEVIGGLAGETIYGWLSVQSLFVPERLRGQGLGRALIERAEAEGRQRGCIGIVVNTFSFQARPFYERLGFSQFGRLEDCPPGYACIYLCKRLAPAA